MFQAYSEGSILTSTSKAIKFIVDDSLSKPQVVWDENYRIYVVRYNTGTKYSDLPSVIRKLIVNSDITISGDICLYPTKTINGLSFVIRQSSDRRQSCLFSCIIDWKETEIKYTETEHGGYLVLPSGYQNLENLTDTVVELINSKSSIFYVYSNKFNPANILGVDINSDEKVIEYKDTVPYNLEEELYLTERTITTAFIKKCKEVYPEIEFYNLSSTRKNLGKESIYYRSYASQERSMRYNSNIIKDSKFGRIIVTTIPLELNYQTNNINSFQTRRDDYLLYKFMMPIRTFEVIKEHNYPDIYGNNKDVFTFSVYWDRSSVPQDVSKQDSSDGSGRDTFSMTMNCDLVCYIIEGRNNPVPIYEVLNDLYFGKTTV